MAKGKKQLSTALVAECVNFFITNLGLNHALFDRRQANEIVGQADIDKEA